MTDYKKHKIDDQQGFTIIELMIALSVLSIILVLSTIIMIQISNIYIKGVNSSSLQNTSRNVMNEVASDIQFGNSAPVNSPPNPTATYYNGYQLAAICIGDIRYTYLLGNEAGSVDSNGVAVPNVLWRDSIYEGLGCTPLNIETTPVATDHLSSVPPDGYEMVPDHMRLDSFSVATDSSSDDVYDVVVNMAYGMDSELYGSGAQTACKGNINEENFCAVTQASTSVAGRVY